MKTEHKIGLIAIIYSVLSFLAMLIIFNFDIATWTLLGSAVALFNYGQLLTSTKNLKSSKMNLNILIRFILIIAVLVFAYFKTEKNYITLIYVLIGLIASKVAVIFYFLFLNKSEKVKEDEVITS